MADLAIKAPFKYTFPVSKAFVGSDGRRRLEGAATGPEVDLQNQRVARSLIDKWVGMVNNGLMPLTYDDNHRTEAEVITTELGTIEKAWKDDQDHMWVSVVLDEDNPVAQYIHKSAMSKGKQYGMSIYGEATSFIDETVDGKNVRTITDGFLTRIAHTTRPVWTPSLGTVISKAVDTALSEPAANGDDSVSNTNTTETPVVETPSNATATAGVPAEATASGAATNPETGKAPEGADGSADATPAEPVEKAVKPETKRDEQKMNKFVKLLGEVNALAAEIGLSGAEATTETPAASAPVQKSDSSDESDDRLTRIEKSVATLGELVVTLANTPDGSAPGALRKSAEVDPLAELNAIADPMERARMAFAALHGENGGTR